MTECSHLPGHWSLIAHRMSGQQWLNSKHGRHTPCPTEMHIQRRAGHVIKPADIYSKLCVTQKWAPIMTWFKKQNKHCYSDYWELGLNFLLQHFDILRCFKCWHCMLNPSYFFLHSLCHCVGALLHAVQVAVNDRPPERTFWEWENISYRQRNDRSQGAFIHSQVTVLPFKPFVFLLQI